MAELVHNSIGNIPMTTFATILGSHTMRALALVAASSRSGSQSSSRANGASSQEDSGSPGS